MLEELWRRGGLIGLNGLDRVQGDDVKGFAREVACEGTNREG